MRNKLLTLAVVIGLCIMHSLVYAQANKTNAGDVVCPATGTSIQVAPARSGRYSLLLNNIANSAVRIGYLDSGTAALTNTTGWVLQPGQATADSYPGVLSKRVVCMSITASSATITFSETFR